MKTMWLLHIPINIELYRIYLKTYFWGEEMQKKMLIQKKKQKQEFKLSKEILDKSNEKDKILIVNKKLKQYKT